MTDRILRRVSHVLLGTGLVLLAAIFFVQVEKYVSKQLTAQITNGRTR